MIFPILRNIVGCDDYSYNTLEEELDKCSCYSEKLQLLIIKLYQVKAAKVLGHFENELLQDFENHLHFTIDFMLKGKTYFDELSSLYASILVGLIKDNYPHPAELYRALYTEKPSIKKQLAFCMTWNHVFSGETLDSEFEEMDYALYLPYLLYGYIVYLPSSNKEKSKCVLSLRKAPNSSFAGQYRPNNNNDDLFKNKSYAHDHLLYRYLAGYDWRNANLDTVISYLSELNNEGYYIERYGYTVFKVCYDIVNLIPVDEEVKSKWYSDDFINFIVHLHKLGLAVDRNTLGELLKRAYINQDLLRYFDADESMVTAQEAYAFNNSIFKSLKFEDTSENNQSTDDEAGVEEDEDPSKDASSTEDDANNVDDGTDDVNDLDGSDNPDNMGDFSDGTGDSAGDDNFGDSDSGTDTVPEISVSNPFQVPIEIVKNDTMSEHLLRAEISKKIDELLSNPTSDIPSERLIVLRRWKSRWFNLLSVRSVQEFLSQFSITLRK